MATAALGGVVWLAKTPVRNAWLKHEAETLSPQVRLADGLAIVDPGGRRVRFPPLLVDVHEVPKRSPSPCPSPQPPGPRPVPPV